MSELAAAVQERVDKIPRGALALLDSASIVLIRIHLPRLVAALEVVQDAASRAIERGTFEHCANMPSCRDEAEPMTESQWCDACRAGHEISEAMAEVERVRAAAGM